MQKWLLTNPQLHAASIMTANTYGLKGAIKAIADGLDKYKGQPAYIQSIRNQIDDDGNYPDELYQEHKQLFDMAKEIVGTIDSFGRHAAGIVLNTDPIDDVMGTQTVKGWTYPTSQVAMKEIDYCNWTKFDVLGLDNIGLISKTCDLAGLPFLTPDSTDIIDFEDEKVWKSMRESNIGIFQFEGDRAGKILKDLFSDETLSKIRTDVPNVRLIDLLSLANAAQRPSGASYVQAVTEGVSKDNGSKVLNDFLAPTMGYLVYQEQQTQFLSQFCKYTDAKADVIRRGIGKKLASVMDEEVPKIKPAFIKTMVEKYGEDKEHTEQIADDFIQVFMDSVNYGFSINHSMAYSYIGYIATWLRYYYPLEFCTAAFEIWKDDQEKINKIKSFASSHGITINPAEFRKSRGLYYMDKEHNAIYEGTAPIKGNSAQVGDDLYTLRDKEFDSFTDFLMEIYDNSYITHNSQNIPVVDLFKQFDLEHIKQLDKNIKKSDDVSYTFERKLTSINKSKIVSLIELGFFDEFGGSKKLDDVFANFDKNYKPRNKTLANKFKKYHECLEYEQSHEDNSFGTLDMLNNEMKYLGTCRTSDKRMPAKYAYVTSLKVLSNKIRVTLYSIKYGQMTDAFIGKRNWNSAKFQESSLITIENSKVKPKIVLQDGKWEKSPTEKEMWVDQYKVLQTN